MENQRRLKSTIRTGIQFRVPSVADPGSGAFLAPCIRIRDGKNPEPESGMGFIQIRDLVNL
jgi:hypothetical protein